MATYLILNAAALLIVVGILLLLKSFRWNKALAVTLLVIIVATAVFDSLIVGVGIVAYDPNKILGLYVGKAPVEDFFYAILAAILVPAVWKLTEKKHD